MKKLHLLIVMLITTVLYSQITRPVGINLAPVLDTSPELVYTNAMQQCRTWIVHEDDYNADWNSGLTIPLSAKGYPLERPYNDGVNPPQIVRTLLFTEFGNHYPSGQYRLIVEGTGQIRFWGAINQTYTTPIDTMITITANGTLFLELEQSQAANPINDIKLIYPTYVNTYQTQKFTTEFLEFLADFQNIRFMDWKNTNGSQALHWSDRSIQNYYTQAQNNGVAWEDVIELANQTQKDIWINIPHLATDAYITQLAQLIHANLNTNLKVYLEYSNELWNGIFQQHTDAINAATALGYTGQDWEKVWKYTSKKSADVFYLFENVFGNSNRLVKVLPTQNVGYVSEQIVNYFNDITYNPNQVTANVIAMAPYFGGSIGDDIVANGTYTTITVSEILDLAEASISDAFTAVTAIKTVATNNNLEIVTYEGGQHLVGNGANADIQVLTDKLIAANRDARMENLYCQYFNIWYETLDGGLFSVFSSHATPNFSGSWGIKEYMDDMNAPKYLGIQNCVFSQNTTDVVTFENEISVNVYPNPANTSVMVQASFNISKIEMFTINGQLILSKNNNTRNTTITTENLSKGVYFLKITSLTKSITKKIVVK